jgi:hypothetical protein
LTHDKKSGCVIVSRSGPAVAFQGRRIAWIYTVPGSYLNSLKLIKAL